MDNVTHALAGGLIAAAAVALTSQREIASSDERAGTFGRTAAVLGIVAAEFPDLDLVYASRTLDGGKLAYLLHHRGYTHTVLFALLAAVVLWALTLAAVRSCRTKPYRGPLLAVACVGTCSHLLLDFTNNYGVHPFWPIESSWYYGDAVFIVEPWLWIVSLPVLWFFTRLRAVRVACALALVAILIAAWTVSLVGSDTAIALTIGAALWVLVVRSARPDVRWRYGVLGWCAIEGLFFLASTRARSAVRAAVATGTYRDVSLTPAPGNPLCFRALAVQVDGEAYEITAASVASFPGVRSALSCAARKFGETTSLDSVQPLPSRRASVAVHWEQSWSAPRADLRLLANQNCEIAAALRFMRVPFWRVDAQGNITLTDLRFGDANGGFAEITTPQRRNGCVGAVPGWRPPRADILTDSLVE